MDKLSRHKQYTTMAYYKNKTVDKTINNKQNAYCLNINIKNTFNYKFSYCTQLLSLRRQHNILLVDAIPVAIQHNYKAMDF